MTSVREATFDLFRAHGMTTIFGNPGSTELPMLADFPDDFTYVLGLQELVVMGMADGFAQASGRPTHVNLHTAPGVGNAVGGIFNAQANKSPLVITAGQQVRPQITIEANLTNRDATVGPQPYVKWSHEPPRAQDVPGAHCACDPPRHAAAQGPGVRLDPHGRLERRGRRGSQRRRHRAPRRRPHGPRRGRAQRPGRAPGRRPVAGPDRRTRHRRRRRLARRHRAGREAAPAGVGQPRHRRVAAGLPRAPPELRRRAPAGDRGGLGDPQGPRPRARRRLLGVPVLPLHPRPAAGRDDTARRAHQRSRRGRPGADGGGHRRRRGTGA